MLTSKTKRGAVNLYSTKKCPYCFTILKLNADKCEVCKKRVGAVNRAGFAQKKIDWKAYIVAILSFTAFIVYIWWAFFRN